MVLKQTENFHLLPKNIQESLFFKGEYICRNILSAYSNFPKGWGQFSKYFRNVNSFIPQTSLINI